MAVNNETVNNLVQEGINLSSEIIVGIYDSKRRKKITVLISLLIVLCAVAIVLWKVGLTTCAIAVAFMGIIGLVLLLVHDTRELRGLKRELDALNHYISH